jgi:adenine-specific DNA-methyltransferase
MARRTIDIEALRHKDKRRNIPTTELEPIMDERDKSPIRLAYQRRNRDLDPQPVWHGKDEQDWSDLIVQAPPLYIQQKVHPKVLIDDLLRQSKERSDEAAPPMPNLFADFNGLPDKEAVTEFYQHDANWSNRMILGDSLSVMASLAEREGLRGKVQCIYIDPPYGIRFNSNFQWSTTSRDVKDGKQGPHHPRARAGQSLSRHLARRHPLLPDLSARPSDRRPRPPRRQRLDLRADRRRKRAPRPRADG